MRQAYRHVRNALKDWVEYYYECVDRLGHPEETPEYKMYTTGVKKDDRKEFDKKGVYIGLPWMSQSETRLPPRNCTPTRLKNWGSKYLRRIGIAVYNLPYRDQKILYAIYHPERSKDMKNSDFCELFDISLATLNRRIRSIYHKVSRELGIVLDG